MPQVLDTRPPSGLHNRPPATAPKTVSLGGDNPFAAILSARFQMPALPALNFTARPEARAPERTPEQGTPEQKVEQNTDRRADTPPVESHRTSARDERDGEGKADNTAERRPADNSAQTPEAALYEETTRPTTKGTTGDKTAQNKATDHSNLREQFAKLSTPMTDKSSVEKTPVEKIPVKAQHQTIQQHPTAQQNGTGSATMRVDIQQATTGLVDHSLKQQPGLAEAKAGDLNSTLNNTGKPAQYAATLTSGGAGQQSGQGATGQNNGGQNTGSQNNGGQTATALNTQAAAPAGAPKALPTSTQGGATQQISGQPASFAHTLSRATASTTGASVPQKPTPRVTVSDQVSVQIKKGAAAGLDKITIKLNPLELGRVDIKMETNDQGLTRALIVAERPETLDLLQRDARGLEKVLQDSGLKTDSGSLSFSLHQDKQHSASRDHNGGQSGQLDQQDEQDQTDSDTPEQQIARGPRHDGDLDISI